jgi:uncharacterized protein YprB with RNaseH-like and TPR domain
MLSEAIRARIARLNRQPLAAVEHRPVVLPQRRDSLPGCEAHNDFGAHWLIRRPLAALAPSLAGELMQTRNPKSQIENPKSSDDLRRLADHLPDGTLLFDLETCGFAGSMVFLIGVIRRDGDRGDGQTIVEQLLARDYREELPVLATMLDLVARYPVLVSYNGKSFDWPMVRDRAEIHRLRQHRELAPAHVDLLHHARRKWKHALPDCRLQTLERFICGRHRVGDLPGFAVPAAYHRFVATRDTSEILSILHHNALDLATLYELALRITQP